MLHQGRASLVISSNIGLRVSGFRVVSITTHDSLCLHDVHLSHFDARASSFKSRGVAKTGWTRGRRWAPEQQKVVEQAVFPLLSLCDQARRPLVEANCYDSFVVAKLNSEEVQVSMVLKCAVPWRDFTRAGKSGYISMMTLVMRCCRRCLHVAVTFLKKRLVLQPLKPQ